MNLSNGEDGGDTGRIGGNFFLGFTLFAGILLMLCIYVYDLFFGD